MRVLQIGMSSNRGGVESFIFSYNKCIVKHGIAFDYISTENTMAYSEQIESLGEKIFRIPYANKHPLKSFLALLKITKSYEIIHVNMLCAANILPLLAAKINGVKKVIAHSHNTNTEGFLRTVLHKINKPLIKFLATDYVACGHDAAEWLFPNSIIKGSMYKIIHNAVDIEKYKFKKNNRRCIREEFGIEDTTLLIGYVGRITLQKNTNFLIEILHKLSQKLKSVKLLIVGNPDGDYAKKVVKKVNTLNLSDYVIYAGERGDVEKFYCAFDIFCMPSLYEGLSFTAIEAQVSGLQCIFSENMGRECMITNKVSFLKIDSVDKWVNVIVKCSPNEDRNYDLSKLFTDKGYNLAHETKSLYMLYQGGS